MAFELFLVSLAADPAPPVRSTELLERLRKVVTEAMSPDDPHLDITPIKSNSFRIEFRGGEATAHSDHVAFRLSELRPEMLHLICLLAKAGDFVIVNEAGGPHIILVDRRQQDRLPPALQDENPIVCESAHGLESVFADVIECCGRTARSQTGVRYQWTRKHENRSIGHGDPEPNVPGLREQRGTHYLYVQAKSKEAPLLHFKRLCKHLRARKPAGKPMPAGGGLGGTGWQIRIPTGEIFNCFRLTGYQWQPNVERFIGKNSDTWLNVLSQISRDDGRATAEIVNGAYFVCDDGRRFALRDCESRRTTDEDG